MAAPAGNLAHNMTCMDLDSPEDVILRIREEHMPYIKSGEKNHKYREYRLDDRVTKIWLYVNEDKAIEYILMIGLPKIPGQVNEPIGRGNRDFDLGLKVSNFGYEILALHKLPEALNVEMLLRDYGVDMTKPKKQYVKKSLVNTFPPTLLKRVLPH